MEIKTSVQQHLLFGILSRLGNSIFEMCRLIDQKNPPGTTFLGILIDKNFQSTYLQTLYFFLRNYFKNHCRSLRGGVLWFS